MVWKTSIDDIKITCKKCDSIMIVESTRNSKAALFVCPVCMDHVNVEVKR